MTDDEKYQKLIDSANVLLATAKEISEMLKEMSGKDKVSDEMSLSQAIAQKSADAQIK